MRRILAAATALSVIVAALGGVASCSTSNDLVGQGACDAFCAKWVASKCSTTATHDDCVAGCIGLQLECEATVDPALRCASIDGSLVCDPVVGEPRVKGCTDELTAACTCSQSHPLTFGRGDFDPCRP